MNDPVFDIMDGIITTASDDDVKRGYLKRPWFWLTTTQYPVYDAAGEYVGMIFNNIFIDVDNIDDVFGYPAWNR